MVLFSLVPRPKRGKEKGLVSTVSKISVVRAYIHKGEGANNDLVVAWSGL